MKSLSPQDQETKPESRKRTDPVGLSGFGPLNEPRNRENRKQRVGGVGNRVLLSNLVLPMGQLHSEAIGQESLRNVVLRHTWRTELKKGRVWM